MPGTVPPERTQPVHLGQRQRDVAAVPDNVNEQRIGNFPFDGGNMQDVVRIINRPPFSAVLASHLAQNNSEKVSTVAAFIVNLGANFFRPEPATPELLAAQPKLHQLLAVLRN